MIISDFLFVSSRKQVTDIMNTVREDMKAAGVEKEDALGRVDVEAGLAVVTPNGISREKKTRKQVTLEKSL